MSIVIKQTCISTDEDIIHRIMGGEVSLFEILIRRNNSVLYKIARSYGFHHHDAEDLMQEAHLAAYLQLKSFRKEAAYKTWLSKIMVNKCLYKMHTAYFKKEHPHNEMINENVKPVHSSNNLSAENYLTRKELSKLIEYSLQNLPVIYRTVFVLREIEGFSVAETAELLSISEVNVKVRLNRAKAILQKELEQVYSSADLFEFNLIYCDKIVKQVFEKINYLNK